jgi:hypothetical protein
VQEEMEASLGAAQTSAAPRMIIWRRGRESNPSKRLCRPLHNLFATSPEDWYLPRKIRGKTIRAALPLLVGSQASLLNSGAGEESRTLDLNLGKVALYQLSYSRIGAYHYRRNQTAFPTKIYFYYQTSAALEREKSLELSTSTLARLRSTN